jgi:hypothetical protein
MSLQPVLCGGNGVATDIDVVFSETDGTVLVLLGVAVLERVRCSPEALQYKMLVGRLANAGWSLRKLSRHFGHDCRTIKQWAAALTSDDVDEVVRAFSGRGAGGKVTPALGRFVRSRYRQLRGEVRSYRRIIGGEAKEYFGVKLSGETLRRLFRQADREDDSSALTSSGAGAESASSVGTGCVSSSVAAWSTRKLSPASGSFDDLPVPGAAAPVRAVAVHHLGMVLFAVLLEVVSRGRRCSVALQRQWIGQVLQGAACIEQSRLVSASDLARFTGPVTGGIDPQRRALHELAQLDAAMDAYEANARLLPDGPGRGIAFYYDPHAKEYTGDLKLLKGWCGGRHAITKVLNLDMLHTESGRPCFLQHYSPYYDLRERFFMTLELFNRLFPDGGAAHRIFVLDRGIYGIEAFERFREEGDDYLTWEKGYRGGDWDEAAPTVCFRRFRARNHAADLKTYRFECQQGPWRRDRSVRRILVRATNPGGTTIEVSVLCSNPEIPIERAVWLMFNRWLQENNFKYLDRHFGLNQLTSYASKSVAECADSLADKPVQCPEYKELKAAVRKTEGDLAKLLLQRERVNDDLEKNADSLARAKAGMQRLVHAIEQEIDQLTGDQTVRPGAVAPTRNDAKATELRRRARRLTVQRTKLDRKLNCLLPAIETAKQSLRELDRAMAGAIREQSRLTLLIDNHYQMLDTRAKAMLDALRITAYNMFAELLAVFRPLYGNYRNDHAMLRNLTRADGFIQASPTLVHFRLWLKGRFQERQLNAFRHFLAELSDRINQHFQLHRPGHTPIRIALQESTPSW